MLVLASNTAFAQVEFWLTDPDRSVLFQKQSGPLTFTVESDLLPALPNVAFKTPEGRRVLIVLNNSRRRQSFNFAHQGRLVTPALNGNAVGTFVW